jgi:outer membrane protein assembly factor BamE (lipoprotein component of BamABCDE complex)
MFDTIAIILALANTVLLVIVFLRLQASASKQDIINVIHLLRQGREKALVANVEKVKKGNTKDDVEKFLGEPDNPTAGEWIYYLDEHSGYVIAFNGANRVETVNSWRS